MELPGRVNGSIIGVAMKEAARRAGTAVRQQLLDFQVHNKTVGYKADSADIVTTADLAAQQEIVRVLGGCFPGYGIIAEEEGLARPCTLEGADIYWTVDPVDGTKALARRQSDSISTMISLVVDGKVVAAIVSDIMTGEVYYFRPGGRCPHRVTQLDKVEDLTPPPADRPLREQYLQLRDNPLHLEPALQKLCQARQIAPGPFHDIEIRGGSIGCMFARLWKQEVGGIYLSASYSTPWDMSPIIGLTHQLGYVWLAVDVDGDRLVMNPFEMCPSKETYLLPNLLVIHQTRTTDIFPWLYQ